MDELTYHSWLPHSDLKVDISQSAQHTLQSIGLTSLAYIEYGISDSLGQAAKFTCKFGSSSVSFVDESLSVSDNFSISQDFQRKCFQTMVCLGFSTIYVLGTGDQIDFGEFGVDIESTALAVAESNHLGGI